MNKLVNQSIRIIKMLYDEQKDYILAFSGGKDSIVIYDLAKKTGLPIQYIHSNTTIDPPGHLRFIRNNYPDVEIINPKLSFFQLIEKKGLPTRFRRFCCQELKEYVGKNSKVIEGLRLDEGKKREKRLRDLKEPESCDKRIKGKIHVYPILNWTNEDIWYYIKENNLAYPEEHYKKYNRLGCVGCPLASKKIRIAEYKQYPKYVNSIIKSIKINIENKKNISKEFSNAYEAFYWWLSEKSIKNFKSEMFKITDYKQYLSDFFSFDFH